MNEPFFISSPIITQLNGLQSGPKKETQNYQTFWARIEGRLLQSDSHRVYAYLENGNFINFSYYHSFSFFLGYSEMWKIIVLSILWRQAGQFMMFKQQKCIQLLKSHHPQMIFPHGSYRYSVCYKKISIPDTTQVRALTIVEKPFT